jgi:hypothetical protein
MTFQYKRIMSHVTLHYNIYMSTAAVFLDIENAFDIIWHLRFLYKLPKLQFSAKITTLINVYSPENTNGGSTRSPSLYSLYEKYTAQMLGAQLSLFADDTSICTADSKEDYVIELQPYFNGVVAWRLEYTNQWRCYIGYQLLSPKSTGRCSSSIRKMVHNLCEQCEAPRGNF